MVFVAGSFIASTVLEMLIRSAISREFRNESYLTEVIPPPHPNARKIK